MYFDIDFVPIAVTLEMIKNKIKAAIEFANGKQFSTSEDIDIFNIFGFHKGIEKNF